MTTYFPNLRVKPAILSSLAALVFSLSAQAGIYTYSQNDSSNPLQILPGGINPAPEMAVSGIPRIITSTELILTFNDGTSDGLETAAAAFKGCSIWAPVSAPLMSAFPAGTPRSGQPERDL